MLNCWQSATPTVAVQQPRVTRAFYMMLPILPVAAGDHFRIQGQNADLGRGFVFDSFGKEYSHAAYGPSVHHCSRLLL